jgi:hypothetical protein
MFTHLQSRLGDHCEPTVERRILWDPCGVRYMRVLIPKKQVDVRALELVPSWTGDDASLDGVESRP